MRGEVAVILARPNTKKEYGELGRLRGALEAGACWVWVDGRMWLARPHREGEGIRTYLFVGRQ